MKYSPVAILKGLMTTARMMRRPIETVEYPEVKRQLPERFRGLHKLERYDNGLERCIGCSLCAAVCPANAITVVAAENDPEHPNSPGERYAKEYVIDELRCIFCGMCQEACPTNAIILTPRNEFSGYTREDLLYTKERLLVPPKGAQAR